MFVLHSSYIFGVRDVFWSRVSIIPFRLRFGYVWLRFDYVWVRFFGGMCLSFGYVVITFWLRFG